MHLRFAAFGAMALTWGLTWIAAKWATEAAPPVLVAGLRLLLACPLFALWCRVAGLSFWTPDPVRLLLSGLLINTGCYSFLFWGVARTPTGLAAIVNLSLIPVFSMLIGAAYREERTTRRRLGAVALGAFGLLLLFRERLAGTTGTTGGDETAVGLAAVVAGTVFYAWGAIVSKPLLRAMPPVALAAWQTGIGGAGLLLASALLERPGPADALALASGRPLAGFLFLVGAGSLVGFSIYLWLLREWGAFRAGLYAFVSPAVAVAVGSVALGEPFGVAEATGMAVMLTATALVLRPEPVSAS